MSLGLTGINYVNPNIYTKPAEVVTGAELAQVTREIKAAAQLQVPASSVVADAQRTQSSALNALPSREAAINYAGLNNVNLSPNAMAAIQNLRAQASLSQASLSIHKTMEGKVFVPIAEAAQSDMKSAFTPKSAVNFFEANSLDKDKRGGSSAGMSFGSENQQSESRRRKAFNVVA